MSRYISVFSTRSSYMLIAHSGKWKSGSIQDQWIYTLRSHEQYHAQEGERDARFSCFAAVSWSCFKYTCFIEQRKGNREGQEKREGQGQGKRERQGEGEGEGEGDGDGDGG